MNRTEPFEADRVPVIDEEDLDEARQALAIYRQAPQRSSERAIDRVMAKLIVAYPAARLSAAEARARLDLYAEQLADIPADVLMAGAMAAVRSLKFFPSIAELRDLSMRQPLTPRLLRQTRLRRLVDAAEERLALPAPIAAADLVAPEQFVEFLARFPVAGPTEGKRGRPVPIGTIPAKRAPPRQPDEAAYREMMGDEAYDAWVRGQSGGEDAIAAE